MNRRKKAALIALIAAVVAVALAAGAAAWWFFGGSGMTHYLLIGTDQWGPLAEGGRSDVMILCTLDMDARRVALTSLARDLQVTLPSGGENRLNTVAHFGDEEELVQVVEGLLGLPIEGYVSVNFSSVVEIVDALGGVTVELTAQEASYLKRVEGEYYGHPLHEGACDLNGAQALAYMRCRQLDSDFGRTDRQAKVMNALLNGEKRIGLGEATRLMGALSGSYRTDLSAAELASAARNVLRLRGAGFEKFTIPAQGTYRYGELRGGSVLVANMDKNREQLWAFLGLELPEASQTE